MFISFNAAAQFAMPDSVCVDALKHYYVIPDTVSGSTYVWEINGVIQSAYTSNEIDITWNTAGIYLLEVQELSVDGCPGPLISGQVLVTPLPVADASSNSPVCSGSQINLAAQTIQDGAYLWTSENGYLSTEQNSIITPASSINAGIYTLVVSANGCTSIPFTCSIIVNNCDIIDFNIPEGFSPNGDGINDLFVIRGIERYPSNTIVIFNRWGDKVFEASPYQNTWNGTNEMGLKVGGSELPIGTYFYILNLGDGSNIYKGTIYLNR